MPFAEELRKVLAKKGDDGLKAIDERGAGWVSDLVLRGRKIADKHESELGEEGHKAAVSALSKLGDNAQVFAGAGKVMLAQVLAHWDDGDASEARRIYLAAEATFEERRAAMQAAGDAVEAAKRAREEAWEATAKVLKDMGSIGLSFLIRVMVTAIAI